MTSGTDEIDLRSAAIRASEAQAVVVGVDRSGVIVTVSDGCQDLLGWRRADLIGTPLTRIIPARFHEAHRAGFQQFIHSDELTLERQVIRLPAVHAIVGEIDVTLELRRPGPDDEAVVVGTLVPRRDEDESDQSELTRVVQQALAADLPIDQLLHNCVAVAARRDGWQAAAVWWIDPWLDRLRAMAIWENEPGAHPSYVAETSAAALRRGEGLVGSVWSTGVPTFHADLGREPRLVRDAAIVTDGLRRGLFFPLTAGGKTVGVVEMLDHDNRPFSIQDQEAVWGLADQLGRLLADQLRHEQEAMDRERIRTALGAGMMGVWSYHLETGLVTWDEQLETMYGIEPGSFGGTFAEYADHIHPDDRSEVIDRIMAAIERRERFEYRYRAVRGDGATVWLQGAGAPVKDSEGRLQALTGVCFDVTDQVESQRLLDEQARHVALAADVGRALVGVEPLGVRLGHTVEAVVNRMDAAFARIWTVDPGESELRLEASAGLYTHLDGAHSRVRVGDFKIGAIAASRQPHLTNDVLNDSMISDPEWARREGMVAFAGYPLVAGDQLVGVLALFAREPLPPSTLAALASIADTVALAILQAWAEGELRILIEESRGHAAAMEAAMRDRARVAEVLQSSLLPPSLPEIPRLLLAASYRPGVEEVGGDFYDVFPLHDGWAFMIGDVCGHGPEAARLTALARHSIRSALLLGHGPADALAAVNDSILAADADRRFCTAVCGTIDGHEDEHVLRLAIGGHPPPLLVGQDREVRALGPSGPLIGIFADPTHREVMISLVPGETLVLYTDGVTEARRAEELFGEQRLAALLAGLDDRSPTAIVSAIDEAITTFSPATTDDVAVLAIGVDPSNAGR